MMFCLFGFYGSEVVYTKETTIGLFVLRNFPRQTNTYFELVLLGKPFVYMRFLVRISRITHKNFLASLRIF